MRAAPFLIALFLTACSSAMAVEGAPPPGHRPELPDHFTNLQVLPKDISKPELVKVMKSFSRSLGVRCSYCHEVKPKPDWAKDTQKKKIARSMMRMTGKIDAEFFTWPKAPRATCYMCHRGAEKPVFEPPPEAPHP